MASLSAMDSRLIVITALVISITAGTHLGVSHDFFFVDQYFIGLVSCSDLGGVEISSEQDCRDRAASIGTTWQGVISDSSAPLGCTWIGNSELYWNTASTWSSSCRTMCSRVCGRPTTTTTVTITNTTSTSNTSSSTSTISSTTNTSTTSTVTSSSTNTTSSTSRTSTNTSRTTTSTTSSTNTTATTSTSTVTSNTTTSTSTLSSTTNSSTSTASTGTSTNTTSTTSSSSTNTSTTPTTTTSSTNTTSTTSTTNSTTATTSTTSSTNSTTTLTTTSTASSTNTSTTSRSTTSTTNSTTTTFTTTTYSTTNSTSATTTVTSTTNTTTTATITTSNTTSSSTTTSSTSTESTSTTNSTATMTTTSQAHHIYSGCSRDQLVELPRSASSTCAETVGERQRCELVCESGLRSVGYFTCSHGVFVGQSKCEAPTPGLSVTVSTKIAATIEVQVEFHKQVAHNTVVLLLKQGVADALGLHAQDIVKFQVVEVGSSSGVQTIQGVSGGVESGLKVKATKRYQVSYEVLPPSTTNADVILRKAQAILIENGTAGQVKESRAFQQAVSGHKDVARVITAVQTIGARTFEDEVLSVMPQSTTQEEDKRSMLLPLWITLGVIVGFCLLIILMAVISGGLRLPTVQQEHNQQLANVGEAQDLELQAELDDVIIRVPSHTLLGRGPYFKSDTRGVGVQEETWPSGIDAEKSLGFI